MTDKSVSSIHNKLVNNWYPLQYLDTPISYLSSNACAEVHCNLPCCDVNPCPSVFQGEEVATTHAKAARQGTWRYNARALSGPSGPPAAGSPQTPHGCQTGSFFQTELSHREGRQHRNLHPWSPDTALRSTNSSPAPLVHLSWRRVQPPSCCQRLSLLLHYFTVCCHSLGGPYWCYTRQDCSWKRLHSNTIKCGTTLWWTERPIFLEWEATWVILEIKPRLMVTEKQEAPALDLLPLLLLEFLVKIWTQASCIGNNDPLACGSCLV